MDPIEEIKQLYFQATAQTIARDVDRAIDLLKTLPDEDARERAAVYMDGLAQMRSEWQRPAKQAGATHRPAKPGPPGGPPGARRPPRDAPKAPKPRR